MIQIIGFLICACLAVKLLEMASNSNLRDGEGKLRETAAAGIWMGVIAVFGFAFWLFSHGNNFPSMGSVPDADSEYAAAADEAERKADCLESASPNLEAMAAC